MNTTTISGMSGIFLIVHLASRYTFASRNGITAFIPLFIIFIPRSPFRHISNISQMPARKLRASVLSLYITVCLSELSFLLCNSIICCIYILCCTLLCTVALNICICILSIISIEQCFKLSSVILSFSRRSFADL